MLRGASGSRRGTPASLHGKYGSIEELMEGSIRIRDIAAMSGRDTTKHVFPELELRKSVTVFLGDIVNLGFDLHAMLMANGDILRVYNAAEGREVSLLEELLIEPDYGEKFIDAKLADTMLAFAWCVYIVAGVRVPSRGANPRELHNTCERVCVALSRFPTLVGAAPKHAILSPLPSPPKGMTASNQRRSRTLRNHSLPSMLIAPKSLRRRHSKHSFSGQR